MELVDVRPLGDRWPLLVWCAVEVTTAAGGADALQLVVALEPAEGEDPDGEVIGRLAGPPAVWARPALADHDLAVEVARLAVPGISPARAEVVADTATHTDVDLDDRRRLRLYRDLIEGPRPDLALPEALARVGQGDLACQPAGVWRLGPNDVAAVWPHDPSAERASDLLARSLATVLDERRPPHEVPDDPAEMGQALGAATARLHLALAEAGGTAPLRPDALAGDLDDHAAGLAVAGIDLGGWDAARARLATADDLGAAIDIHGDLHPGRWQRRAGRWEVADVAIDHRSGAPASRPTSPLRDLAAMITGVARLVDAELARRGVDATDLEGREPALLAEAWEERTVDALVRAYAATEGIDALLPRSRDARDGLLVAFELAAALGDAAGDGAEGRRGPLPRRVVTRLTPSQHHRPW